MPLSLSFLVCKIYEKERGFGESHARRHRAASFCGFDSMVGIKRKRPSSRACVLASALHCLAVCPWAVTSPLWASVFSPVK